MRTNTKALDLHKSINGITALVSDLDWPGWRAHASVNYFSEVAPNLLAVDNRNRLIFPTTSIFSLVGDSLTGSHAESNLVGCEGVLGHWLLGPEPHHPTQFFLQTAGFGIVVSADFLRRRFEESSEFRLAILNHLTAMVRFATQTCVCYRFHTIKQQIAKMLLQTLRRTGGNIVKTSHETIGKTLGVRRESVTDALTYFEQLGLITKGRRLIVVTCPDELGYQACECYHLQVRYLDYTSRSLKGPVQDKHNDL